MRPLPCVRTLTHTHTHTHPKKSSYIFLCSPHRKHTICSREIPSCKGCRDIGVSCVYSKKRTRRKVVKRNLICDECHRKHSRCDKKKPTCNTCKFAGTSCTYTRTSKSRKKRNKTTSDPATQDLVSLTRWANESEKGPLESFCGSSLFDGPGLDRNVPQKPGLVRYRALFDNQLPSVPRDPGVAWAILSRSAKDDAMVVSKTSLPFVQLFGYDDANQLEGKTAAILAPNDLPPSLAIAETNLIAQLKALCTEPVAGCTNILLQYVAPFGDSRGETFLALVEVQQFYSTGTRPKKEIIYVLEKYTANGSSVQLPPLLQEDSSDVEAFIALCNGSSALQTSQVQAPAPLSGLQQPQPSPFSTTTDPSSLKDDLYEQFQGGITAVKSNSTFGDPFENFLIDGNSEFFMS